MPRTNPEAATTALPRPGPAIRPRVAVQCRDRLLGDALVYWCGQQAPLVAVGPAEDAAALLRLCRTHRPALVVVEADGEACGALAELEPPRPYVIGLLHGPEAAAPRRGSGSGGGSGGGRGGGSGGPAVDRIVAGSAGMAALTAAVHAFLAGGRNRDGEQAPGRPYRLTARELDVLGLLGAGFRAAEIGLLLGVSRRTVENHQRRIYTELDVHSGPHAVATAAGAGLLPPAGAAAPVALTRRERQILELADRGYSTKQTARLLRVSDRTVENMWRHLYGKLGVHCRAAALAVVHTWGT